MLVMAHSMKAYFKEALGDALQDCELNVTDLTQAYLVHLLHDFSRSEKAFAGTSYGEKPVMAQLLQRALCADEIEALNIFRHLGDSCLYILGFFKESNEKRMGSSSYYLGMGSHAYSHASSLSRAYAASNAAIFLELSERFPEFVKALEKVSEYGQKPKSWDGDIV